MRSIMAIVVVAFLACLPMVVSADLVPCGDDGQETCQTCHVVDLVNNVIEWLIAILGTVAAIMFIYAGFKLVTSGGNVSAKTEALRMMNNLIIGYIIVLSGWLLIDTGLKALLSTGESGFGMWNEIECVVQPEAQWTSPGLIGGATVEYECLTENACHMLETDCTAGGGTPRRISPAPPTNIECVYPSGGSYTGSCSIISSGPCSVENLRPIFGSRAEDASRMCNKESGGAPIRSGSDLCCGPDRNCSGAPSFSGGYFQINILSEADKIPGCVPGAFHRNQGQNRVEGECVRRTEPRPGAPNGVCTGWSCEITDMAMYNTCMRGALDHRINLQIAGILFNSRGFQPWLNSRNICGIPN
jgi:hypothetical protein